MKKARMSKNKRKARQVTGGQLINTNLLGILPTFRPKHGNYQTSITDW